MSFDSWKAIRDVFLRCFHGICRYHQAVEEHQVRKMSKGRRERPAKLTFIPFIKHCSLFACVPARTFFHHAFAFALITSSANIDYLSSHRCGSLREEGRR